MTHPQSDTVHVFDTWVKGTKRLLHFDVMTTDEATALTLAKQHLTSIGEGDVPVTVNECQFCHTEPLVMFSPAQQRQFREQGGFIITLSTERDAEKVRQHRSRIVQTLNVPQRVRLGPSLAAAWLDGLFEHPVPGFSVVQDVGTIGLLFCLV